MMFVIEQHLKIGCEGKLDHILITASGRAPPRVLMQPGGPPGWGHTISITTSQILCSQPFNIARSTGTGLWNSRMLYYFGRLVITLTQPIC